MQACFCGKWHGFGGRRAGILRSHAVSGWWFILRKELPPLDEIGISIRRIRLGKWEIYVHHWNQKGWVTVRAVNVFDSSYSYGLLHGHVGTTKPSSVPMQTATFHFKRMLAFWMLWIETVEHLPSRELTYPTSEKGKSSSKVPLGADMLVARRVFNPFEQKKHGLICLNKLCTGPLRKSSPPLGNGGKGASSWRWIKWHMTLT